MKSAQKSALPKRRGFALIISMIFVLIFSALALSMAALSGTNVQIADNLCNANRARASAESGIEIVRFWLSNIAISGTTPIEIQFYELANSLQSYLAANNPNVTAYCQTVNLPNGQYYSSVALHISSVALDSDSGHT